MTTLSTTLEAAEARSRAERWAQWEAKGAAHDARLRERVRGTLMFMTSVALFALALYMSF